MRASARQVRDRVAAARVLGRRRLINSILGPFCEQRSRYPGGVLLSYGSEFASADRGCRPNQFRSCEVYSCALWSSSWTSPALLPRPRSGTGGAQYPKQFDGAGSVLTAWIADLLMPGSFQYPKWLYWIPQGHDMSISGAEIAGTEPVQTTELDTDANSHDVEARRKWLTEAEVEAIIRHASGPRDKLMILRKLRRQKPVARYIFLTDRGAPMTRNGFFKLRQKAAAKADISDVHLHLLRHATGFKLVNQGF